MPDDPTPALFEAATDHELTAEAFRVLAVCHSRALEPHAYRPVDWQAMSRDVGMPEPAVRQHVGMLASAGYLERGSRGYRVLLTRLKAFL